MAKTVVVEVEVPETLAELRLPASLLARLTALLDRRDRGDHRASQLVVDGWATAIRGSISALATPARRRAVIDQSFREPPP